MRRALTLSALLLAAMPVTAQAEWSLLRSEHFDVAGDVSARELRVVALRLEQFRDVILKLSPEVTKAADRARVIALVFPNDRSFRPFLPRAPGGGPVPWSGIFANGPAGAYIGLSLEAGDRAYPTIYHEYAHALLAGAFVRAPTWFNEGLAEYYSTLEVTGAGRGALIGKPLEHHVTQLRERRLPLQQLFAVRANSPEYREDSPVRRVFYAQSWAVVHHALHGTPRRRKELIDLAFKLASGADPEQSVRETYGLSLAELERDIETYVRRSAFQYTSFEFTEPIETRVRADVTVADGADVDAWLGGLALHTGSIDEAAPRLERALKARPDVGTTHLAMAFLRSRQGRNAEAQTHMAQARAHGALPASQNPIRLHVDGDNARQPVAGTSRVIDNATARRLISTMAEARPANDGAALALAEILIHLGDVAGARRLLGPVLARGAVEADRERARALLARLADVPAPAAAASPVEAPARAPRMLLDLRPLRDDEQRSFGMLASIDCRGDGVVIVVRTDQGPVRAEAASLGAVDLVTFRPDAGGDITCGAQREVPALLTWRPRTTGLPVAVALELLPDGFVP